MLKLTYLLVFLIGTSLISCEKKTAAPSTGTTTPPPIKKDTLSGKIYSIAGNGIEKSSGDGGPADSAGLAHPDGVAVDAVGNIYISDIYGQRIRKVNTSGIISTIAGGNGHGGFSGDGGPATSAQLNDPGGLALDGAGNIYIVDNGNNRIRKVNTNGIISTVAGGGSKGLGDGGPADSAQLSNPTGITLDGAGNLYIADFGDNLVRKVSIKGIISTVAGGGNKGLGDGGSADSAILYDPSGVAVDASGNIYIASAYGNRIRKVNTSGIISTIAGDGNPSNPGYSGDGGPAINAELSAPLDVKVDGSGNIYIADANNYCIRKINTSGIISTYAGNGIGGYSGEGGLATDAKIGYIPAIALDSYGNLYIADIDFNRVQVVYK
jgi:sugar lactone lactonase YvrE